MIGFSIFGIANKSYAQSNVITDENAKSAIELSKVIQEEYLLTDNITSLDQLHINNLSQIEKLRYVRQFAHGAITLSNKLDKEEILKSYKAAVETAGLKRDRDVYNLHRSFLETVDLSSPTKNTSQLVDELETATKNKDWFVANNAWLLKSILSSYNNNFNIALQQAHEAYELIPEEISPHVTDARILTLVHTTYLNNLLLDPDLAIQNTAELITQKQLAGYPIDGSSLLNNLLYSLSKWREYEVSTVLSQAVLDIESKVGSNTPGLTELRVAQLFDRQGKFENALNYARAGLQVTEIQSLKEPLQFLEINALSGLGSINEARQKLFKLQATNKGRQDSPFLLGIARARLGLAISENNEEQIYESMNALFDLTIQNHLRLYSTNTSQLLASLENTKERQAEREAGLKREADLQKAKAEQKTRVNQLLMVLVALLSLAAILAIFFARYRDKISKELAIKTAEAEDADRMKSEFLGMVSHELRTPLNGIVGIADLLAMQAPTKDLRHKAGIILDSSNKLTHVIESIVDMSTIDGDKMELYREPTDIHAIVRDVEQLWRPTIENKGVTFTCFVEDSLSDDIILDKARVRQCLNNLLSNAAKFTDNGRVHLHVTSQPIDDTNETEVTAIIADTGQGMSETVQGKLFTPFLQADSTMTRKHGGSGLGLAITQSLARMMGGDVTMVSNQGRGSEFTLTLRGERSEAAKILDDIEELMDISDMVELESSIQQPTVTDDDILVLETIDTASVDTGPAADETSSAFKAINAAKTIDLAIKSQSDVLSPTKTEADLDDLRGLKILIVEDIPANQDVIKLFLKPEGCESQCAANGVEALDILNTQAIDIILMDIRMPEMDGIEATQAIRKSKREYKDTPIIALTADASAETNAACMAAGADIFLTKPVMAKELIEAIRFIRRFQDTDKVSTRKTA